MDIAATKMYSAILALVPCIVVACSLGYFFSNAAHAIGRNPVAKGEIMGLVVIGMVAIEFIALIGVAISIIILFAV